MLITGGLDAQETVLLCLQDIAAGMACLHGLGVLHRCAGYCAPLWWTIAMKQSFVLLWHPWLKDFSVEYGLAQQPAAAQTHCSHVTPVCNLHVLYKTLKTQACSYHSHSTKAGKGPVRPHHAI